MTAQIGEKIRFLRKKRKLTQSQLAGEGITRNMLSLIENGSAAPSIQTLEYLSQRLGVSPAYFFINSLSDSDEYTNKINRQIKDLYKEKEYQKAIELLEKTYTYKKDELSDEMLLIAAEASMHTGKKKLLRGAFESATEYFRSAREYSAKCAYSTEWIDAHIFLYESVIENSDCPMQSMDKDYYYKIRRCTGYELFNYLYAIRLIDDKKGEEAAQFLKFNQMIEPAHKEHINAKFMLLSENVELKKQALDNLQSMIKSAPSYPLDAISRYLILKDIEQAARTLDDFETAYKYASMRIKIISDMRD